MIRFALGSAFAAVLIVVAACGPSLDPSDVQPPDFSHEGLAYDWLRGRLGTPDDAIGSVADLMVIGDYLLIADYPVGGSAVHVLRSEDGRRVSGFGEAGEGPGEFGGIPSLVNAPRDRRSFWAYDANLSRLTLYHLSEVLAGRTDGSRHVRAEVPRILYDVAFLDSARAVGLGLFAEGRIGLFDPRDPTISFVGELPAAPDGVPASVVQHAHQGRLAVRPDGRRFTLATSYAGLLEIRGRDGRLVRRADVPFAFEPDYTVDDGSMIRGLENRMGYADVQATDRYIVALFSGRAEAHFRREMRLGEYLHLFNWDGDFVHAYRLDRPVSRIAVDVAGRRLFAAAELPEPVVVTFPWPPVPSDTTGEVAGWLPGQGQPP
ncbi:MAG: BF3164 family lipoprotein [Gemmatimonadota bacterium]